MRPYYVALCAKAPLICLTLLLAHSVDGEEFRYVPSPCNNPLKGLVPYARPHADRFPHSMEFNYLPLSELMKAEDKFDWQPLEDLLNDIASRKMQTVFRIWMEYPGRDEGIPPFLVDQGVRVTEWLNTNTEPFPPTKVRTPDYNDPRLRKAMKTFVLQLGERYDGDPRIGFITAGLLGTWGEWHTYPRTDLMANKQVQIEVMNAYATAFKKTPVLLRYPAGENSYHYAPNHDQPFGYHDDSFAWATLDTGKKSDSWFFVPAMKSANAENKWKTHPIGGEVRPEVWAIIFDKNPNHPKAQDFTECVQQTHATWMMETGMFKKRQPDERIQRAIEQVQKMGYDFHIASVEATESAGNLNISIDVLNRGVAPFYHDWSVEIGWFSVENELRKTVKTNWKLQRIMPRLIGTPATVWKMTLPKTVHPKLAIRVVNPLPNGLPLYFANEKQLQLGHGWLQIWDGKTEDR